MQIEPFDFNGRLLSFEPINITAERAVHWFRNGKPVTVTLEPGDATRYDLMLVPHTTPYSNVPAWSKDDSLMTVVRYVGGEPVEASIFRIPIEYIDQMSEYSQVPLGRSNNHTRRFLFWWLRCFSQLATNDSANTALPDHPTTEHHNRKI